MDNKVPPVEDFVFEGLSKRVQQVFDCPCMYTTANDKTAVLKRISEGRDLQYPYIFMTIQTLSSNPDSYNAHFLARKGIVIAVGETQSQSVRLLPANFEIELEFVTNKFKGLEQGSVLAYSRRWLFARRLGYLKFNVKYGRLVLPISLTMGDAITVPLLDNKVEAETAYKVTANLTVHGYVSEPELSTQGVLQEVVVNGVLMNPDGSVPDSQFFSFN